MSRQESPTQSTGAHRKHRAPAGRERSGRDSGRGTTGDTGSATATARAPFPDAGHGREQGARSRDRRPQGTLPMQPPAHYEPYLDGLFTYCLSVLCEHDAAASALGEVLALAERQRAKLRDPALRPPWLYALARWACLRRLAAGPPAVPPASDAVAEQRRAQLAALAWPEAAGTTPEQREALELAVRHQLSAREVAHVLGLDPEAARALLAQAACAVERTRTALAVVDTGRCPALVRLAGDARVLLGPALRDELVRHVDDCGACRRTAERVVAAGPWPGAAGPSDTADATAVLALVEAPRSAAYAAQLYAMDAGLGRTRDATPRFDRRGFPLGLKDRAARRARLRHRAVTGTVVAAVIAAPVLALWAAYHAAPLGEGQASDRATSEPDGLDGVSYERAGGSGAARRGTGLGGGSGAPGLSLPTATTVAVSSPPAPPPADGSGYVTVAAHAGTGRTVVVLTAVGDEPVRWQASTSAYWLRLSDRGGSLQPGQSVTVAITADRSLEPEGSWDARIGFTPGHATVILHGSSTRSVPPPVPASPAPAPTTPAPVPTTPKPAPPPPTASPTPTPSDSPSPPPSSPPPPTTPAPTAG
ncbi:hypothetical protein ACFO3J_35750 [Streptomyces polygonati]|uniref:BACON domain-containing protein n=1 Tax=Streptomyces polygonati TaxID=1617087 RepID=A0ABV8HXP4_9ACTN